MATKIQKKDRKSGLQSSAALIDRAFTKHRLHTKFRQTGKVSIDQYMEALRKEVILSQ